MWFFTKKTFLVDALEGVVDIHNHLLPGIDDGADTIETTREMISLFKEIGFKSAIATPHTMEDYYGNDVASIKACMESTQAQVNEPFMRHAASEYMMDGNFENLIDAGDFICLKDNIILTELSYFQKPNNLNELVYKLKIADLQPILAHPERYTYITDLHDFKDLKQRGFTFQLNLLSLSGHYGHSIQKMAANLLAHKLYDYIGTDAHKPEHLIKIKEIQITTRIADLLTPICKRQQSF